MTHMDPEPQHHPSEYVPRTRVPHKYPRSISRHPPSERQEWRLPEITPARGEVKARGPHHVSGALEGSKLVSGLGWKRHVVRAAAGEGRGLVGMGGISLVRGCEEGVLYGHG